LHFKEHQIDQRNFTKITTFKKFHLLFDMKCIPRTLKVCNDFRLEATKNSTSRIVPRLNTDGLICLAVKWMGWVGSCADMMGWVDSAIWWVGLGEEKVTHFDLYGTYRIVYRILCIGTCQYLRQLLDRL